MMKPPSSTVPLKSFFPSRLSELSSMMAIAFTCKRISLLFFPVLALWGSIVLWCLTVTILKIDFGMDFIVFGARLGAGIFLLNLLVSLRYVGSFAIAQCSTFPLPHNPYEKVLYTVSSISRLLDTLLLGEGGDSQMSNKTLGADTRTRISTETEKRAVAGTTVDTIAASSSSSSLIRKEFVRYKNPTITTVAVQIILHAFLGALFAKWMLTPMLSEYKTHPIIVQHVICSCAISSSISLFVTYIVNEDYHELSPKVLQQMDFNAMKDMLWKQIEKSGFLFYWLVLPPLTIVGICWYRENPLQPKMILCALMLAYTTTGLMSVYTMAADVFLRKILVNPRLHIDRLVTRTIDSRADCTGVLVDDVIVEVILGGLGKGLVECIMSPRLVTDKDGKLVCPDDQGSKGRFHKRPRMNISNGVGDLESEEQQRNDIVTSMVKTSILQGRICGYTSFEDDLLKLSFLESIGGSKELDRLISNSLETFNCTLPLKLSKRHLSALSRRLKDTSTPTAQPSGVPVLRAICVYIGGIGDALSAAKPTTIGTSYSLPKSATISVQYAVVAASRLIILNMEGSSLVGKGQKQFNRISLMLPVVLESIFRLRSGVLDHARYLYEVDHPHGLAGAGAALRTQNIRKWGARTIQEAESFESFLTVKCGDLSNIVKVCDGMAATMIQILTRIDGTTSFDASVNVVGCENWMKSVVE